MEILYKIERFIGQVKFAVIIILIFTAYLIYGTFQESYHGAEYANRHVYKSIGFMLVQFLMFISIFNATLFRLPFRKNLSGFYVLHLGLLLLFIGSFVSYHAGIDSSILLSPNTPSQHILSQQEDELVFTSPKKQVTIPMPFSSSQKLIDQTIGKVTIKEYLPFADEKLEWKEHDKIDVSNHSSSYLLMNDMFTETITLSLFKASEFEAGANLGPLSLHYLPSGFFECFKTNESEFILWNSLEQTCITSASFEATKAPNGMDVIKTKYSGQEDIFIPRLSPLPVFISKEKKLVIKQESPLRLLNRSTFKDKPHLFLFGENIAYFDRDSEKWVGKSFTKDNKFIELPWMGFKLELKNHFTNKYPILVPHYTVPIQDNNKLIAGATKALRIEINDQGDIKSHWLKSFKPLKIKLSDGEYNFYFKSKSKKLPFQLILDKFRAKKDPGTNRDASYESFVTLVDGDTSKHHIFMNNPLVHKDLTFYQSTFQKNPQTGETLSGLTVNYDPGRWLKYLGSLLLVLGSFYHFVIRRKIVSLKGKTT